MLKKMWKGGMPPLPLERLRAQIHPVHLRILAEQYSEIAYMDEFM
jgi:hypothetical protein